MSSRRHGASKSAKNRRDPAGHTGQSAGSKASRGTAIAIRSPGAWGGKQASKSPFPLPRNASNTSGKLSHSAAAAGPATLFPPAVPKRGHRRRNSSYFNVGEVDLDELEDEEHVPLTSAGYKPEEYEGDNVMTRMSMGLTGQAVAQPKKNLSGKKKLTAGAKGSTRVPAPSEPSPDNKFYQFYQAIKYLNNAPLIPRPDSSVAGQLVSDAFGPVLKLRRQRALHLQAMQRTWLEYGRHKGDQSVMQHLLLNSSVSSREFDMMILGKLGPTIFGQHQKRGLFTSTNNRDTWVLDEPPTAKSPPNTATSEGSKRFSLGPRDRSVRDLFDPTQFKLNVNQLRGTDPAERVRIAASLIRDAIARRQPKARSKWRRRFAWFYENRLFQTLLVLASFAYTFLILFEPPSATPAPLLIQNLAEIACILVFIAAIVFRFLQSGFQMLRNGWVLLLVASTALFVLDVLNRLSDPDAVRFSRFLRPLLLLPLHPKMRRITLTFFQALRNILLLTLFFATTLGAFAVLGIAVFDDVGGYRAFASLPNAVLALYQAFAARDMSFMYPGFLGIGATSLFYFGVFCVIVVFVIAALLFAQMYSTFDAQVQIDAIRARIQERRALAAAFALLDQQAQQRLGFINLPTFSLLLAEVYRTPPPKREVEMLFRFVDHDNNNLIDILEFFDLCDILFLRFETASRVRRKGNWLDRILGRGEAVYVRMKETLPTGLIERIVIKRANTFNLVTQALVVLNAMLVLSFALAEGHTRNPVLMVLNWVFSVFFVIEVILRIAARGWLPYWVSQRNRFDLAIIGAAILGQVLEVLPGAGANTLAAGTSLSTLRLLRVVTMVAALRRVGRQVYGAAKPTASVFAFIAVFLYVFSAIGMELFGARFRIEQAGVLIGSFATFPRAFLTLVYISFSADWPVFLAEAQASAASSAIGTTYFVVFTGVVVLILLNLLSSLIVLMYVKRAELETLYPDALLQLVDPNVDLDLFGRPRRPLVLPPLPRLPRDYPPEGDDIDAVKMDEDKVVFAQKIVRGFLGRKTLARRKEMVEAREFIAQEILQTEKSYTKALSDLITHYLRPLQEKAKKKKGRIIPPEDVGSIFSVVEILANYNNALCADIEKRTKRWTRMSKFGDVFIRASVFLKTYTMYINNYDYANERVEHHRKKTKAFRTFLTETEEKLMGVTLESLLIQPVQRIPRYELLLGEMLKNTWRDHPDYNYLRTALRKLEEVGEYLNDQKREQESKAKVHEIALKLTQVDKNFQLEQPWRLYICQGRMNELKYEDAGEGRVARLSAPKERAVFLFTDLLLVTTKKGSKFRVNNALSLSKIDPDALEDEKKLAGIQHGVYISHPQYDAVLAARSFNGQRNWLLNLRFAIQQEQDRVATFTDAAEDQNRDD